MSWRVSQLCLQSVEKPEAGCRNKVERYITEIAPDVFTNNFYDLMSH